MATYQSRPAVAQPYHAAAIPSNGAPAGTFAPGTKVQIGSHRVVVEKYLSEGGFAHVYVVRLPGPDAGTAVLKRVAVPDKDALANMRNEVETMKRLRGHKHIVMYIDSHASQLKGGGYEVFLLMEYCAGGGLIDFMNTRLKNRLTEPEIVDIFGDAAEGVAYMHYLKPPLLHRDLKVENILISNTSDGRQRFKLCDFGSAAPPRPAAKSASEGRLIEEDVQRHTTLQYRSPEMVDVYRHKPIDEKSDIWALGVLLYKLCYYTTPFEEQGQMAILRASFKYPAYPQFSDHLKKLIAMMLMEEPSDRPNIYQVIKKVSNMRGKECPIKDVSLLTCYAVKLLTEGRSMQDALSLKPVTPKNCPRGNRMLNRRQWSVPKSKHRRRRSNTFPRSPRCAVVDLQRQLHQMLQRGRALPPVRQEEIHSQRWTLRTMTIESKLSISSRRNFRRLTSFHYYQTRAQSLNLKGIPRNLQQSLTGPQQSVKE